jgi:hypothetical protein
MRDVRRIFGCMKAGRAIETGDPPSVEDEPFRKRLGLDPLDRAGRWVESVHSHALPRDQTFIERDVSPYAKRIDDGLSSEVRWTDCVPAILSAYRDLRALGTAHQLDPWTTKGAQQAIDEREHPDPELIADRRRRYYRHPRSPRLAARVASFCARSSTSNVPIALLLEQTTLALQSYDERPGCHSSQPVSACTSAVERRLDRAALVPRRDRFEDWVPCRGSSRNQDERATQRRMAHRTSSEQTTAAGDATHQPDVSILNVGHITHCIGGELAGVVRATALERIMTDSH